MTTAPELPSVERGEMKMELPSFGSNEPHQERSMAEQASRHVAPPEQKYGVSFGFVGGGLNIKLTGYGEQNGSGEFVFGEDELDWDSDEETGRVSRVSFVPKSELLALRDILNKYLPANSASVSDVRREAGKTGTGLIEDDSAVAKPDALPLPSSPNKVEDLIRKLRQFDRNSEFGKPHLEEAATLLQDQQSEISRLKEELQDARDKRNRWFTAHGIERTARVAAESQVASLKAALKKHETAIGVFAEALDTADRIIERACGTSAPKGWTPAYRKCAKARSALSNTAADKGDD